MDCPKCGAHQLQNHSSWCGDEDDIDWQERAEKAEARVKELEGSTKLSAFVALAQRYEARVAVLDAELDSMADCALRQSSRVAVLREALDRLVNKSNSLTAEHRHNHTMTPHMDLLYARQLEAETVLTTCDAEADKLLNLKRAAAKADKLRERLKAAEHALEAAASVTAEEEVREHLNSYVMGCYFIERLEAWRRVSVPQGTHRYT